MLHLILGLVLAAQTPNEPKVAGADLEKALNEDALGAGVISVGTTGDLIIFDGAITIPSDRPSVEECGVLMSMSPKERPGVLAEARRKADTEAYQRRLSATERMTYVRQALEPKRECQALFKRKCDELKQRVPLAARKTAVADARKAIDRLLEEDKVKGAIRGYLANVLAECTLEE